MENFGKFMTILLTMIINTIINGFVFCKLWSWFIVTTFQVQSIRLVEAIGISLLIGFIITRKTTTKSDDFWETFIESTIFMIIVCGFALFGGYVIHLFM